VLLRVAVCVAGCCRVCCSVLQGIDLEYVAVCYSVLQRVLQCVVLCCRVCCGVLHYVAECVAVTCSNLK